MANYTTDADKQAQAQRALNILSTTLANMIDEGMIEYARFKTMAAVHIPEGILSKCENVMDIIERLETEAKISPRNLTLLEDIARTSRNNYLLEEIEKTKSQIQKIYGPGN